MSLLEEIQTAAVEVNSDLGSLLRKCKVLAARLGSKPLEDWLLWESNGYPKGVEVPDYRIWSLRVKGHFSGPGGSGLKNAPIPLHLIPERARKFYERYECRQSVASIEALLKDLRGGVITVDTADLALLLGNKVYQYQNCVQSWAEFSPGNLIELLNAVRNRILDFTLAVWKEAPKAGESQTNVTSAIQPAKVTQIFNTTIYGGSANLVGTAHESTIAFNINTQDFASLSYVLRNQGVTEPDIKELEHAIQSDQVPKEAGKFGPKVSSWIATMIGKAANGSWNIAIGAAGNLLGEAIAKYYGM